MDVADHERITRFLLNKRWFSKGNKRVKPDAFIPHPHLKLSVSCTEGLREDEVWPLGHGVVAGRSDSVSLLGRADLKAKAVREQGLLVKRDDTPPRHANIVGWPENGKDVQRMKAVELAAVSTLVPYEGLP